MTHKDDRSGQLSQEQVDQAHGSVQDHSRVYVVTIDSREQELNLELWLRANGMKFSIPAVPERGVGIVPSDFPNWMSYQFGIQWDSLPNFSMEQMRLAFHAGMQQAASVVSAVPSLSASRFRGTHYWSPDGMSADRSRSLDPGWITREEYDALRRRLEDIRDLIDGMADTEDVPDSTEVRPNVFMRIDQIIDEVL